MPYYYVPDSGSDYTIDKKLASAHQFTVSAEDKDTVLNATDKGSSDQVGGGYESKAHLEAFNRPVMSISEEVLEPQISQVKNRKLKACKRLSKLKVE